MVIRLTMDGSPSSAAAVVLVVASLIGAPPCAMTLCLFSTTTNAVKGNQRVLLVSHVFEGILESATNAKPPRTRLSIFRSESNLTGESQGTHLATLLSSIPTSLSSAFGI